MRYDIPYEERYIYKAAYDQLSKDPETYDNVIPIITEVLTGYNARMLICFLSVSPYDD